ncbi:MAG: hypothetical protein RMM06_07205, partial [Armatimonadota bacterium]|nr:hypothetical protein [Armatimonadota bacterium]
MTLQKLHTAGRALVLCSGAGVSSPDPNRGDERKNLPERIRGNLRRQVSPTHSPPCPGWSERRHGFPRLKSGAMNNQKIRLRGFNKPAQAG